MNLERRWLTAIIDGVRRVTHIAPADANGQIVEHAVVEASAFATQNPLLISFVTRRQDGIILTPPEGRSRCLTDAAFR